MGGSIQKTFRRRGMDIFWSNTLWRHAKSICGVQSCVALKPVHMTGWKNLALQVPLVVPNKALGNFPKDFPKALHGTTGGTCTFLRLCLGQREVLAVQDFSVLSCANKWLRIKLDQRKPFSCIQMFFTTFGSWALGVV